VVQVRLNPGDDLERVISEARRSGSATVDVFVENAQPAHEAVAARHRMRLTREILRMARPLPVDEPWQLTTRPFQVGIDEAAWIAVNNRAFAWHPDQGGWTLADVEAREAEKWFDPDGFLLHERDGRLAGFCWTKIHRELDPPVGEIYVIGVDPDFHGGGLGRALVLAGLDWLHRLGMQHAMLYVEADNDPALRLYRALGFTVAASDRWWRLEL
jgi:mycothiol synthase